MPECRKLLVTRLRSCVIVIGEAATPMTGTVSAPRFTSEYSAGNICLYARSPVTPKSTNASEGAGRSFLWFISRSSREDSCGRRRHARASEGRIDHCLRLGEDLCELRSPPKAFPVDLVNVLSARGA